MGRDPWTIEFDPERTNGEWQGNRVPRPVGVSFIRKQSERRPFSDLDAWDEEIAEQQRQKAALEAKEKSRAEHEAKQAESAVVAPPEPVKPQARRKKA